MQNFIDAVPTEIDEAHMDGASHRNPDKLVLPLIRPGIAAVAVIGNQTWNDYITVLISRGHRETDTAGRS
jgi:ABC-type glycerol-3-phosphate transport system permease component